MTFADLMSLLMCFFVLLLSFAELDVMKFKAIAGSMKLAFGVQRDIKAIEVPKGTSIIAQEFSSGKPEPTVIAEIRQQTQEEDKQSLEFTDALVAEKDGTDPQDSTGASGTQEQQEQQQKEYQAKLDAERLAAALEEEIAAGMIQIETEGVSIIIRIREKGSFASGVARFDPAFEPAIAKLRNSLQEIEGTITVAGHTDNVPISTRVYRSNWDLSSARGVSVVHAMLKESELDPARFVVEGHGDAHPLMANDSSEGRALNRRVEITIRQQDDVRASPEQSARHETGSAVPPPADDGLVIAGTLDLPGIPVVPDVFNIPFGEGVSVGAPADKPVLNEAAESDEKSLELPTPAAVALPNGSPFGGLGTLPFGAAPDRAPDEPRGRLGAISDGIKGKK